MHVGFFSPAAPESGAANGIVTYVRVMRDALRLLGHSVTVVSPNQVEHSDRKVAVLPPVSGKIRSLLERRRGPGAWARLSILNAFHAAREAGVEVFEIEESFGWASYLSGVPIVLRAHGPHVLNRPWTADYDARRAAAELAAFKSADAVTFTTRAILDQLNRMTSWRAAKVIPNPIATPKEQWTAKTANLNQILFVGRIDARKGADLAIDAFSQALRKRPAMKLLMVGPGEAIDAPPEVQFLGPLGSDEISKLRLESALALCTSRFESFHYSLTEAMALGMPVVTTDWPGSREVVMSDSEGRVVSSGELPNAIVETIGDAAIGAAARISVAQRLDPKRIAEETLALYRSL